MLKSLVGSFDYNLFVSLYGRVVYAVVIIELDIFVDEQFIHVVIQNQIFGYSVLQTFSFGEKP